MSRFLYEKKLKHSPDEGHPPARIIKRRRPELSDDIGQAQGQDRSQAEVGEVDQAKGRVVADFAHVELEDWFLDDARHND